VTQFRQPPAQSDIYITVNQIVFDTFIVGSTEARSSWVGLTDSSEPIGNDSALAAGVNMNIYIPLAKYNSLASTNQQRESIIRAFVNKYVTAGIIYTNFNVLKMRNLNTSAISSQASFKFKRGTFDHLQLAYREALDSLGRGLVTSYLTNTAYRLWGLVNNGNTTDYNISAGAVFYNGEVYLVDTAVFSAAVGETAVAVIVTTYFQDPTADPVTFTDGGARNVHEIKKIKFQSGLSGSGIADFASLKRANKGRAPKGCAIPYYPATGDLSEFDATGKGISVNTLGWALCNGQNGTVKLNGRVIAMYDPADR
jgi:hypothetical protein